VQLMFLVWASLSWVAQLLLRFSDPPPVAGTDISASWFGLSYQRGFCEVLHPVGFCPGFLFALVVVL